MNITINEPCHENWDAMTPNQQGAFCKSCQKNVVDFSKKTLAEIKDFFSKPQEGKVCGRFEQTQLSELSFDDFFSRFRYWNFSKKFAIIFFLSFGFWLFSNEAMAQNEKYMLKGEVAYFEPVKTVRKDTTKKQATPQTTVKQNVIMGKVKCTKPATINEEKKTTEPEMKMGQVIADPVKKEKEDPKKKETTLTQVPKKIEEERMVMGMIAYLPDEPKKIEHPTAHVVPVIKVEEEKSKQEDSRSSLNEEAKVIVYPNPSNGRFTIEAKEKQTLHLFDETGKLVLTQDVSGSANINAEHLKNGVYTLTLTGATHPTIKKIIVTR